MSQSLTELHTTAQEYVNQLTDELNIEPVNLPELEDEPNAGYIGAGPNEMIRYGKYSVYFHGFPDFEVAHRYVIIENTCNRIAEIYISGNITRAVEFTAAILRGLED